MYVATSDDATNKGSAVGLGLVVAAIWASSAYYGYSHTAECKEAIGDDDFSDVTRARPVGVRRVPVYPRPRPRPSVPATPAPSSGEKPAPTSRELPPPFSQ